MINNLCRSCDGRGWRYNSHNVKGMGFAARETCAECEGTGEDLDRDPWMKPTLIFIAVFVAYMIWQFLR